MSGGWKHATARLDRTNPKDFLAWVATSQLLVATHHRSLEDHITVADRYQVSLLLLPE